MIDAVMRMEAGRPARDVARELGATDQTLCNWRSRDRGMDASELPRLLAPKEGGERAAA